MSATKQGRAHGHEVGDGVFAIADEFVEDGGDKGEGFGVVESDTACEPALCEEAGLGDNELIDLIRTVVSGVEREEVKRPLQDLTSFGANCIVALVDCLDGVSQHGNDYEIINRGECTSKELSCVKTNEMGGDAGFLGERHAIPPRIRDNWNQGIQGKRRGDASDASPGEAHLPEHY
jgi:hypothetical protein